MTIMLDMGNFWIEYHLGPLVNVANGANYNKSVNLDRPGHVVGAVPFHCVDQTNGTSGSIISDTLGNPIAYGTQLTSVSIICANNSGIGGNVQMGCIIFVRA